jgi:uncharacterized protein (TIGR03435 family)
MMRRGVLLALPVLLCVTDARYSPAQSRTVPPAFEEASVKPTERCSMQNSIDPGRIALNGDPLKLVLMEAFQVKTDQILGPSWLDSDCFVILAKMPEGATKDQLPAMLQALLVERFKLAAHKETHSAAEYALRVDKSGPKFRESDPNLNAADKIAGRILFHSSLEVSGFKGAMTIARFASLLSGNLGSPVEDLTGLTGKYDIDVSWARDPGLEKAGQFAQAMAQSGSGGAAASTPSGLADLFTALRETLGLRLEARKAQVEVVVIGHLERVPAEN